MRYRADFIVCDTVLVEIKSVERFAPIHTAQLLTYLKLLKLKEGLLINFNVQRLMDGVRRVLNGRRRRKPRTRISYVIYVSYVVNFYPRHVIA